MAKILNIYNKINELRAEFYSLSTNKESLLKLISEAEVSEQVYNSNAIENSTLTLEETEKILLQIDLDRYITERELFEAKNLARVVTYINNKATEKDLNLDTILLFHKMLLSNIRDDVAGRFRQGNEMVRVANHIAPPPSILVKELEEMISTYNSTPQLNIIKRIALLHLEFENIHPFVDGNGRIGRVLNNFLLIKEGWVPINIKFIDRKLYYNAFKEFDTAGKTSIMEEIVGKALTNSYHKRITYLKGIDIVTLTEYAKKKNISHSNLLNKANRQTIAAFLENEIWKIGIE